MRHSFPVFIAGLGLASLVSLGTPALAQEPAVTLTLIAPAVRPKAPVYLNATLANPGGLELSELRQVLTFRRQHLRFVRAELGVAGYLADATLTVELRDASGAAVEDKDAAEQVAIGLKGNLPLPPGPLVELEFRQIEDTEQSIKLNLTAEVRDGEGNPVPGLAYTDPEITVSNDLGPLPLKVFSCFFYMH